MREMILRCHEALEKVEAAPMLNLGRAVSVVRMTLAMATDLNARLERLERSEAERNG